MGSTLYGAGRACACGHSIAQHKITENEPGNPCGAPGCACEYARAPLPLAYSFRYLFWGLVSNASLDLYYYAPREMLQNELFLLHRFAVKKAHTIRLEGEQKW
jgi:hypothetical protein